MKKIILPIALLGLAITSCSKDQTCNCTVSQTISGTEYSIRETLDMNTFEWVYIQESEPFSQTDSYSTKTEWEKVSSKQARSSCPVSNEESAIYDETYTDSNRGNLIEGVKGSIKNTTKCKIE